MDKRWEWNRNMFQRFAVKMMERRSGLREEVERYWLQIPFLDEKSAVFPNASACDYENAKNNFMTYWIREYGLCDFSSSLEQIWEQAVVPVYHDDFLPCIILKKNKGYITLESMLRAMEFVRQLKERSEIKVG